MESKVMDATNDDKWGASSTLMLEIANGTHQFQQFNEIMNILVKRLSERESYNWRKVYKGLTLLEYLIKNGSERVVDFARSNLSLVKTLRNFHCIDEKGKDQGINVKNRAKEIVELLSSTERIKEERKKAKANRTKYIGISSEPSGFGSNFSGNSSLSFGTRFSRYETDGGLDSLVEKSRFEEELAEYPVVKPKRESKAEAPLPPTPMVDLLGLDASQDEWSDFQSAHRSATESFAPIVQAPLQDEFGDFQSVTKPSPSNGSISPTNGNSTGVHPSKPIPDAWEKHKDLFSLDNLSLSPANNPKPSRPTMDQLKEQLKTQPTATNFNTLNPTPQTNNPSHSLPNPLNQADLSDFDSLI
ncbi:Epsin-3, clathrin recruitment and traffic between the Golgi and endosome [Massospora cicadina]|nr:Epsin-3, clathrin recruitment and traffic between the Golgi and endosome [Massospora cicadina]